MTVGGWGVEVGCWVPSGGAGCDYHVTRRRSGAASCATACLWGLGEVWAGAGVPGGKGYPLHGLQAGRRLREEAGVWKTVARTAWSEGSVQHYWTGVRACVREYACSRAHLWAAAIGLWQMQVVQPLNRVLGRRIVYPIRRKRVNICAQWLMHL